MAVDVFCDQLLPGSIVTSNKNIAIPLRSQSGGSHGAQERKGTPHDRRRQCFGIAICN
jgi:hypothetical protein